jgi:hypothetical protein
MNSKSSFRLSNAMFTKNILSSKVVLYFLLLLAISNLFYFSIDKDTVSICIFFIIGFITSFFNKNMVIILLITIAITNILKNGTNIVSYNEGMCGGGCGCNNMISNN